MEQYCGFVGVSKVGNKYQARLQVPGDGRGGLKKRRQVPLPGPWDTAEDAAVMRATRCSIGLVLDGTRRCGVSQEPMPHALPRREAGRRP